MSSTDPISGERFQNGAAIRHGRPSAYSAIKSATTTVTGQSEAVPTGAAFYDVTNLDATNYGLVAFGATAGAAEINAANGVPVLAGQNRQIGVPAGAVGGFVAWLGDTGTVDLIMTAEN